MKSMRLFCWLLYFATSSPHGAGPTAEDVIQKTLSRYRWMSSCACTGTMREQDEAGRQIGETSFSLRLSRPNLYQIVWSHSQAKAPTHGAVLNAGGGAFLYPGYGPCYQAGSSDAQALSGAAQVSSGATATLPALFFGLFAGPSMLSQLERPRIARHEAVAGEECFVIAGQSPVSSNHEFWISRERFVILRDRRVNDALAAPAVFKNELAHASNGSGTTSSLQTVQNILKTASKAAGRERLTCTEEFQNIQIDEKLKKDDFVWHVPAGSPLKMAQLGGGGSGAASLQIKYKPGQSAPEFTGKTIKGQSIVFSDYRNKIVLLDFWATWCGPCVGELPNVARHYEKYHPLGIEIIGISLDNSPARLEGFLKQHPEIKWPQVFDGTGWHSAVAELFGVHAIPQLILIGPDGIIRETGLRGARIGEAIDRVLHESPGK